MTVFILYTENIPLKDGQLSTGLARVNNHVVGALGPNFKAGIGISFDRHNVILIENLDASFAQRSITVDSTSARVLLQIVYKKFFHKALPFLGMLKRSQIRKIKAENADFVFVSVGIDTGELDRAVKIAELLGLPLVAYLVDEVFSANALIGRELSAPLKTLFRKNLARCSKIFSITQGLVNFAQINYGIHSSELRLPYRLPDAESKINEKNFDTVFIGNTSHFYQDGIVDFLEVISELNLEGGCHRLVFTISTSFVEALILRFGVDLIKVKPCRTNEELGTLLGESYCALMPYSFHESYKDMVSTSFPSKMLEYLAYAKKILTYAPRYSSAIAFADYYGLEFLVDQRNKIKLRDVFSSVEFREIDMSGQYREILEKDFSYESFRRTVCGYEMNAN